MKNLGNIIQPKIKILVRANYSGEGGNWFYFCCCLYVRLNSQTNTSILHRVFPAFVWLKFVPLQAAHYHAIDFPSHPWIVQTKNANESSKAFHFWYSYLCICLEFQVALNYLKIAITLTFHTAWKINHFWWLDKK